jgi:hypothetical protein
VGEYLIPLILVLSAGALASCSVDPMIWTIGGMLDKRPVSNDVALGDLDRDGDLDAFFANGLYEAFQPNTVALNDGTGQFSDSGQQVGRMVDTYSVALGDLDADGDLDARISITQGGQLMKARIGIKKVSDN